jgi:riboflavin synthase
MSLILIVEDNEKNMKLVRDVLQAKGYTTIEAVTGEEGVRLRVHAPGTAEAARVGDSVSINGVCLTATEIDDGVLSFDVPETFRIHPRALASEGSGERRAGAAGREPWGHIVQGHVDGVGRVGGRARRRGRPPGSTRSRRSRYRVEKDRSPSRASA